MRKPPEQKIKLQMTDKELLVASAFGIVVFYFVTHYIRRQVTGTTNEAKIKKHLRTITIIFAIAMAIQIISLLDIFNTSDKKILSYKCDYEGLRQAEIYRLAGSAVTNPSLHVSVHMDCNGHGRKDEKLIFAADGSPMTDKDVTINWVTFDTLSIEYKKGLRIFTQIDRIEFSDSTLDLHVTYKELE